MPLVPLNLYCTPADVFDQLSTEGVELRLDDHDAATGQVVTCAATAGPGATALAVAGLTLPLLAGTVLNFESAGMPYPPVQVVLSAVAQAGATSLSVNPLPAAVNNQAQARDSGVNLVQAQRAVIACQDATAQVKLYCSPRYDDSDLVQSYSVRRWARSIAAYRLAGRRGQARPASVKDDFEETLEELKGVRRGVLNIEDIGTRTAGWPFFSNSTVDLDYTYAKVRIEQSISELTPTQYGQYIDWNSVLFLEW